MTETKIPATFSGQSNAPGGQRTQPAQANPVKTAPPSGQRTKPGRKPLFRS